MTFLLRLHFYIWSAFSAEFRFCLLWWNLMLVSSFWNVLITFLGFCLALHFASSLIVCSCDFMFVFSCLLLLCLSVSTVLYLSALFSFSFTFVLTCKFTSPNPTNVVIIWGAASPPICLFTMCLQWSPFPPESNLDAETEASLCRFTKMKSSSTRSSLCSAPPLDKIKHSVYS